MRCGAGGAPSRCLPLEGDGLLPPGEGDAGGGGGMIGRTDDSTAVSDRMRPPWMKRRRRAASAAPSRLRIRCLSATTVVVRGCGMSCSRSGLDVENRTVRLSGGAEGGGGGGGARGGGRGGG